MSKSLHKVSVEFDGVNLVKWFRKSDIAIPFSLFQKLLRKKSIKVNGVATKKDLILSAGDEIFIPADQVTIETKQKSPEYKLSEKEVKENFLDVIIYEDEHILALNKPRGLAVQGGSKVGVSVDGIISHLAEINQIPRRYHLVHRLDKDTSGLLLIAKNRDMSRIIGAEFKDRIIEKKYLTAVVGIVEKKSGRIASKLGSRRSPGGVEKVVVDNVGGKLSVTHYKVLKYIENKITLLEVEPKTGRKHQIRAHLTSIGFPILGDGKYGGADSFIDGYTKEMQLHSWKISSDNETFPKLEAKVFGILAQ